VKEDKGMNFYFKWVLWKVIFAIFGGFMSMSIFRKYKKENSGNDKQYALGFFILAVALILGNFHSKVRLNESILLIINFCLFALAVYYFYKAGFFNAKKGK
jgi:amino acid permease